ncbi:hypothetical protein INT45_013632 [Circinella minor]|uniref:Reverse transcriptase domain-containing protein n=1 Tax=Circinella minor TaxID=1195481 RepID=A0A8H7RTE1_9FUNG|nr:hypothetical protein INT45_013632 [Circinella minor]
MILNNNNISIASINCNGLLTQTKNQLIRHLHAQQAHIITLQETHTTNINKEQQLHTTFRATQSFWTPHCGIVALSSDIQLTQLTLYNDDRHLLVRVEHTKNDVQPFFLLTLYAPQHHQNIDSFSTPNYHDEDILPTFRRGDHIMSTIDYIFASTPWTDHALLYTTFDLGPTTTGKGYWRGNLLILDYHNFRRTLALQLTHFFNHIDNNETPQQQWELLKDKIKKVMQKYSRERINKTTQYLTQLQSKRNKFLRQKPSTATKTWFLPIIEKQISIAQKEVCDTLALKAGVRWRELGETSAGYLKTLVAQNQTQINMPPLINPATGAVCDMIPLMHDAATSFYSSLYTPTPIDDTAIQQLHQHIPPSCQLSDGNQISLTEDFTLEDLITGALRAPKRSSPGLDGLPYGIWKLIFKHPIAETLVITTAQPLINPQQTGFMPNRFIATNGLMARIIMENAQQHNKNDIGITLDQNKAYNCIHPSYLTCTLKKFGFPESIIHSIAKLFFNTHIRININGHLSTTIQQQRGL